MARSRWIPSVVVALVAAALYLRTVGFEFVFDDLHLIVNNVLLHAVNAALVLALARRLGTPGWASFCAAFLFAVHPVAAWPVASIVARVDLLPALFVLLAWLALCAGTVSPLRRATLAGLLFLLALLSKESALAFLV